MGAVIGHHTEVDSAGNLLLLGNGIQAPFWWKLLSNVFLVLGVAGWLVSIAAQVLSYRRSTGDRRQQLKWLMCGSAVALIAIVAGSTGLAGTVGGVGVLGFLALPLSIGVGVLRYGLLRSTGSSPGRWRMPSSQVCWWGCMRGSCCCPPTC